LEAIMEVLEDLVVSEVLAAIAEILAAITFFE
jgi:hypothetical protein